MLTDLVGAADRRCSAWVQGKTCGGVGQSPIQCVRVRAFHRGRGYLAPAASLLQVVHGQPKAAGVS